MRCFLVLDLKADVHAPLGQILFNFTAVVSPVHGSDTDGVVVVITLYMHLRAALLSECKLHLDTDILCIDIIFCDGHNNHNRYNLFLLYLCVSVRSVCVLSGLCVTWDVIHFGVY